MQKLTINCLLLVAFTTGCVDTDSREDAADDATSATDEREFEWWQEFRAPTPPEFQARGAGLEAVTIRMEWADDPDRENENLIGATRFNRRTGEDRYFTAEELRRGVDRNQASGES